MNGLTDYNIANIFLVAIEGCIIFGILLGTVMRGIYFILPKGRKHKNNEYD